MRRSHLVGVSLGLALLVLAGSASGTRAADEQEPVYEGMSLHTLLAALKDERGNRSGITQALGVFDRRARSATEPLVGAMKDGDIALRGSVAQALGRIGIGAESAVPALIATLHDKDRYAPRAMAAWALGRLGGQPASLSALVDALNDEQWRVRGAAAEALGEIGPEAEVVDQLIDLLKDDEVPSVRSLAAGALGRMEPRAAAVAALCDALRDDDQATGVSAAVALGNLGPGAKAAVPALRRGLKGFGIFPAAAQALSRISPNDAKAIVPRFILTIRGDSTTEWDMVLTVGRIGPAAKEAVPVLRSLRKNRDDPAIHIAIASALARIDPAEINASVALMSGFLADKEDYTRMNACHGLGEMGPVAKAAVPVLGKALQDRNAGVREEAAWALARISPGSREAVALLIAAAKDRDLQVHVTAVPALGNLKAENIVVDALIAALKDEDVEVRWQAARALGKLGGEAKAAAPALASLAQDSSPGVRHAAAWALKKVRAEGSGNE